MRCPYCDSPLSSGSTACDTCHLTFPKTCALFGTPPHITKNIYDSTRKLTAAQADAIHRLLAEIHTKYPELNVQFLLHSFPPPHPLKTQLFWLFNTAGICRNAQPGSTHHTIAIAIDPDRMDSAMIPSYALEPYLSEDIMSRFLEAADADWQEGDWSSGLRKILHQLDLLFASVTIPDTSGSHFSDEF
jgi:hypothetical protein